MNVDRAILAAAFLAGIAGQPARLEARPSLVSVEWNSGDRVEFRQETDGFWWRKNRSFFKRVPVAITPFVSPLFAFGTQKKIIVGSVSADVQTATTNPLVINKPTGVAQGDLLLAWMFGSSSATWTGDTGWTEVIDQGSQPSIRVAWLLAGASEPSSYSFPASTNMRKSGGIAAFTNAAFDTIGTISTTATSGVQVAPAITLSKNGSVGLVLFSNGQTSRTWSAPSAGLSGIASDTTSVAYQAYSQTNLPSGSTGSLQATCSVTTGSFACVQIGIKPVP